MANCPFTLALGAVCPPVEAATQKLGEAGGPVFDEFGHPVYTAPPHIPETGRPRSRSSRGRVPPTRRSGSPKRRERLECESNDALSRADREKASRDTRGRAARASHGGLGAIDPISPRLGWRIDAYGSF